MKIIKRIILILFTLIFLVSLSRGIYYLIKFESATAASGNVLTDEFLRTDHVRSMYSTTSKINFTTAFVAFFGGLHVILIPRIRSYSDRQGHHKREGSKFSMVFTPLFFAIMTGAFFSGSFLYPKIYLNDDPEIVICEVEDKYQKGVGHKKKYYVVYTNGTRDKVSMSDYHKIEPGDYFYKVYFGEQYVKTYDGSRYSLPNNSDHA